jgi:hypothetical protein
MCGGLVMFPDPDGGGLVGAVFYVVALGVSWAVVYLVTGSARRLSRRLLDLDLRRRLQVEEGKVTKKRKDRGACWVGIGATMYQVRSQALFDSIRLGTSYRTYRTKASGRLVALEELSDDAAAGYRDDPRRAPGRSRRGRLDLDVMNEADERVAAGGGALGMERYAEVLAHTV